MDDGRAASDAVMASSGALPREASFLFASFSLDAQRERSLSDKKYFQPEEHDAPKH